MFLDVQTATDWASGTQDGRQSRRGVDLEIGRTGRGLEDLTSALGVRLRSQDRLRTAQPQVEPQCLARPGPPGTVRRPRPRHPTGSEQSMSEQTENTGDDGLRERLQKQGEDALGQFAQQAAGEPARPQGARRRVRRAREGRPGPGGGHGRAEPAVGRRPGAADAPRAVAVAAPGGHRGRRRPPRRAARRAARGRASTIGWPGSRRRWRSSATRSRRCARSCPRRRRARAARQEARPIRAAGPSKPKARSGGGPGLFGVEGRGRWGRGVVFRCPPAGGGDERPAGTAAAASGRGEGAAAGVTRRRRSPAARGLQFVTGYWRRCGRRAIRAAGVVRSAGAR